MRESDPGTWNASDAQAWDLVVSKSQTTREAGFLTWAFKRFAGRNVHDVLDLGCGTGRLAIELALRGYSLTGIDKHPAMLDKARQNAGERGVELHLCRTSLENLDIDGEFDAAFSAFTTLNYVLDEARLSVTLGRLKSLLRPGGVLVVDSGNFAAAFGSWKRATTKTSRGKGWSVRTHTSHRLDDVNMLWYHTDRTRMKLGRRTKEWKETRVLRMWTFPELKTQLLANGFTRVRLFGRMKAGAREAKTHARRLVIVANR